MAISSSSPAVAARCAYAQAGVGVVASQNVTDPSLGPKVLDLLARGATAGEAVGIVMRSAAHPQYRQVLAVDARGESAIHSGSNVLGLWAEARDKDVACGGNLLANETVPAAMLESFQASDGDLGDRLMTALQAGLKAGGEAGPVRSAGLKLVREVSWPVADLRCDWSEDGPIEQLAQLWTMAHTRIRKFNTKDTYPEQKLDNDLCQAVVTRAIDPSKAPSFGVPGDR